MKVPDFFIVGAPKCGTSALYTYLSAHPDVFMSPAKEPHYFSRDVQLSFKPRYDTLDQYLDLFTPAQDGQLCGEASTSYLRSNLAIEEILRMNPAAKLIAMVRNPLDMMPSVHAQALYEFVETEPDFEAAWQRSCLEPDRRLPAKQQMVDYKTLGRLGLQISRLTATAPREQTHVIVFDDFVSNPDQVYRDVLTFLDLKVIRLRDFPAVNVRKRHRFPLLSQILMAPPFPFSGVKRLLKSAYPGQVRRLGRTIYRMNSADLARPLLSEETRISMAEEFADDIDLLGRLIGRDLNHWHSKHHEVATSSPS